MRNVESGSERPEWAPPPETVQFATNLLVINLAVSLIASVVTALFYLDHRVDATLAFDAGISRGDARAGVIWMLVIGFLLSAAFTAFFFAFLRRPMAWARLVYVAIATVAALWGLMQMLEQPGGLRFLEAIGTLLTFATIALLFRPDANAFYRGDEPPDTRGR